MREEPGSSLRVKNRPPGRGPESGMRLKVTFSYFTASIYTEVKEAF